MRVPQPTSIKRRSFLGGLIAAAVTAALPAEVLALKGNSAEVIADLAEQTASKLVPQPVLAKLVMYKNGEQLAETTLLDMHLEIPKVPKLNIPGYRVPELARPSSIIVQCPDGDLAAELQRMVMPRPYHVDTDDFYKLEVFFDQHKVVTIESITPYEMERTYHPPYLYAGEETLTSFKVQTKMYFDYWYVAEKGTTEGIARALRTALEAA